jgi:hypothetical protein
LEKRSLDAPSCATEPAKDVRAGAESPTNPAEGEDFIICSRPFVLRDTDSTTHAAGTAAVWKCSMVRSSGRLRF